jgi:hypothetical protein
MEDFLSKLIRNARAEQEAQLQSLESPRLAPSNPNQALKELGIPVIGVSAPKTFQERMADLGKLQAMREQVFGPTGEVMQVPANPSLNMALTPLKEPSLPERRVSMQMPEEKVKVKAPVAAPMPVEEVRQEETRAPELPEEDVYAQAAEDERRDKMLLALGRAAETIGRSIAGGGVVTAEKGDGLKSLEPLVGDQLAALEAADKGKSLRADSKIKQLTAASETQKSDPNSEASKAAREMYASVLEATFGKQMADKVRNSNASQRELEERFGKYSLANKEAIMDAVRARREQAEILRSQKDEQREARKEEKMFGQAAKLRAEIAKANKDTNFTTTANNYLDLKQRFESGKFTGVDDVKAIYALIKALDPGSVVRESEVGLIIGAESLLGRAFNFPRRITKGDLASEGFRKKLIDAVRNLYETRKREFEDQIAPVVEETRVSGIDPKRILYPSIRLNEQVPLFDESSTSSLEADEAIRAEEELRKRRKTKEGL